MLTISLIDVVLLTCQEGFCSMESVSRCLALWGCHLPDEPVEEQRHELHRTVSETASLAVILLLLHWPAVEERDQQTAATQPWRDFTLILCGYLRHSPVMYVDTTASQVAPQTLVTICQTKWRHILEHHNLYFHFRGNLAISVPCIPEYSSRETVVYSRCECIVFINKQYFKQSEHYHCDTLLCNVVLFALQCL
jgi:hypothetical protein